MVLAVISCLLHSSIALLHILKMFHSYAEQVMTMCRVHERQFSHSYFKLFSLGDISCNFVSAPCFHTPVEYFHDTFVQ